MEVTLYIALIALCLLLSAFFSGSETALLRLRKHELDEDARDARGPAVLAARELTKSTSRLLVTLLLGNNIANVLAAALASAVFVHFLGAQVGIFTATVVIVLLVFIFCEVLPKAVAASHPRAVAYSVALPLYLLHQLLRPVHVLFDRLIEPVVRRVAGGGDTDATSPEEVLRLARSARESEPAGSPLAIIGATAGAAERTVEEIMTPRTEIVAFRDDIEPSELLERVLEERYTRVPVYRDSIDTILGVVHLKELVKLVRENGGNGSGLQNIVKPVLQVPARKKILLLLQDMQSAFVHLAVVKDEFAVTLGIVTQEDELEELVGEIRDEFDREELLTIRVQPDGSYRSLGRIKVLDFNRHSGWTVPAEPGDTLSGLVFNQLGRSPRRGDIVRVPGYELRVADVSGTRITEVWLVERADAPEAVKSAEAAR